MKLLLTSFVVACLMVGTTFAQTQTVMNFQRADCSGKMHDLFADLDEGNVVIVEFFMQGCAPCISSGKKLETMRATLETSFPGKVKGYAIGFTDTYTCSSVASWVSSNGLTAIPMDSGAAMIKHYGGFGMPTVVICAGVNEHKVLGKVYIGMSTSDVPTMQADIRSYLMQSTTSVTEAANTSSSTRTYPNPASDVVSVDISDAPGATSIDVIDVTGAVVSTQRIAPGTASTTTFDVAALATGTYILMVRGGNNTLRTLVNISR
ncbi:hypothetical protein BH10BAC6_BH10BAC6_00770 [soil metagenome]